MLDFDNDTFEQMLHCCKVLECTKLSRTLLQALGLLGYIMIDY